MSQFTVRPDTDPLLAELRVKEARQRRAIEDVLNPGRRITYQYLDLAINRALQHGWNVAPAYDSPVRAHWDTRTIYTTPIYGDRELAAFFHEGGHLEPRDHDCTHAVLTLEDGRPYHNCMPCEQQAWRYSMKTLGFRWNAAMQRHFESCIRGYHGLCIRTYPELLAMEAVIAEGEEQARHIVWIRPRPRSGR